MAAMTEIRRLLIIEADHRCLAVDFGLLPVGKIFGLVNHHLNYYLRVE